MYSFSRNPEYTIFSHPDPEYLLFQNKPDTEIPVLHIFSHMCTLVLYHLYKIIYICDIKVDETLYGNRKISES